MRQSNAVPDRRASAAAAAITAGAPTATLHCSPRFCAGSVAPQGSSSGACPSLVAPPAAAAGRPPPPSPAPRPPAQPPTLPAPLTRVDACQARHGRLVAAIRLAIDTGHVQAPGGREPAAPCAPSALHRRRQEPCEARQARQPPRWAQRGLDGAKGAGSVSGRAQGGQAGSWAIEQAAASGEASCGLHEGLLCAGRGPGAH